MRRPFVTRYSADAPPGALSATIRFKSPLSDEGAEIADAARDKFSDLANAGALCGEGLQPDQSEIRSSRTLFPNAQTAIWSFADARIDPGSLTVLVNFVEYIHTKFVPVTDLEVKWAQIARLTDPSRDDFPQAHQPVSFDFTYDDALSSFDIVVEFHEPQPIERVEEIEGIVGAWFSGANLGGYGDDSSAPAITSIKFAPDVSTVSEDSIVWYIDRFACTRQAIDGLVNVVEKVHRRHARVRSLEIGA
jgi:hypothetical protein